MIEKRYAGMGAGIGIPEKLSVEKNSIGKDTDTDICTDKRVERQNHGKTDISEKKH